MKRLLLFILVIVAFVQTEAQVSFGNALLFDNDWLFSLADDSLARNEHYDDSGWRRLDAPHDWSREGQLSASFASCQGYLPGGIGWYRKHFDLDKTGGDAPMHYIYFEGVYCRSTVYLNGHELGYRPSGYASFMYDMTPYLKDKDNVLAVRVDHSKLADSRWYSGSGIIRDVYLIAAPETHLSQWGLGWKALNIDDKQAVVEVENSVDNADAAGKLELLFTIYNAKGKKVSTSRVLYNKESKKQTETLKIDRPHLWDVNTPYLYTLNVALLSDGKEIDHAQTRIGLRTLRFDANKGFFLNGQNMKVKGVCLHHDAGVLGAVVPREVWKRKLRNLKEMGVNAIRMSHNPQVPMLYDLCDEMGFLVMDEASDEWEFPKRKWVEGWNKGTPAYYGTFDFFEDWIDRDVTDMVRRDRNHPCVFLWSIGNEVDYPNDPYSHPVLDGGNATINQPMYGGYKKDAPNAERIGKIAKRLVADVKAVDSSRPTTGALAGVVMSNETEYPEAVDVVGYNYTENRYDQDHATYPERIIYGSETGVGYYNWTDVTSRDFIFGQFIWTGTDYLGESGAWPSRGLNTGLLDFGAFRKGRGWFRTSLWSEKPMCYIGTYLAHPKGGRRRGGRPNQIPLTIEANDTWNYNDSDLVRVVCYTTSAEARLLLNDSVIGEPRKKNDSQAGMIYWDVRYKSGTLRCEALKDDKVESTYEIRTGGEPYRIVASVDPVNCCKDKHQRFCLSSGDVAIIEIQVLDENGNIVKSADNDITCSVEGEGTLLGLENSNNTDMSGYTDTHRKVYNGRLVAYVRLLGKDPIRVRFSSSALKDVEVEIKPAVLH